MALNGTELKFMSFFYYHSHLDCYLQFCYFARMAQLTAIEEDHVLVSVVYRECRQLRMVVIIVELLVGIFP